MKARASETRYDVTVVIINMFTFDGLTLFKPMLQWLTWPRFGVHRGAERMVGVAPIKN